MPNYPLEQLVAIKKNRFEQAVRILEEKKALLEKAQELLAEVTKERNEVAEHKKAKLDQLREELDQGTTSDKVQQMKVYLKTVDEKLAGKEKKVTDQTKQVDLAQKQVDLATQELFQRKKDLEKLEIHRTEWRKEEKLILERKEEGVLDELGSATNIRLKNEEKRRDDRDK